MTNHTAIRDLKNHVGETVTLAGWLYNSRRSGKIAFLILRDGTGLCQCVLEKNDATEAAFEAARSLGQESSLTITGEVRADERSLGGHELAVTDLAVEQAAHEYPITPKEHGTEFLMRRRHLWFRSRRQTAILRIRSTLIDAIRRFYSDRGFTLIDTPIFAPAAGEGAQTLFNVDYFGEEVYLAQTGQLYLESAAMALGKVYCFGPTFRAEKSKTRRHLTEFWMVEPEVAWIEIDELLDLAEEFVESLVARCLSDHADELKLLGRDLDALRRIKRPFQRISYTEAADMLHNETVLATVTKEMEQRIAEHTAAEARVAEIEKELAGSMKAWKRDKLAAEQITLRSQIEELAEQIENAPKHIELARSFQWGKDLGGSDETIISKQADVPTIVHRYPKGAKAFYMKADRLDPRVVLNFDMLAPEGYGEIIGGSCREDDLETLQRRMAEMNLDESDYDWYLDLRRYGSVPHGGFGLGVERTLAWICGLKHIRECIPFPRMMGKLYP